MRSILTLLEFDEVFASQTFMEGKHPERIDFRSLESCHGFCDPLSFQKIRRRLNDNPARRLTFLGCGHFHYVTLALLERVRTPFTLLLFDHHTDLLDPPVPGLISCGSWVRTALDSSAFLRKVVIIGADEGSDRIPPLFTPRVKLITNHRLSTESTMILAEIPTKTVYVSIDKDALSPQDARTDWDQGRLRIAKLLKILRTVGVAHRIIGADICGEAPHVLWPEEASATEINDSANRRILETLLKLVEPRY
jgi:arginase family enzyme